MNFIKTLIKKNTRTTNLFYVGQAGFIVRSKKGQLLAVDLYLSDCVEREEGNVGYKRLLPKILEPNELVFDVIVATHPHLDHFDMDSIPIMLSNDKTYLYASQKCNRLVEALNLDKSRIKYIEPGDQVEYGDFKIYFVSCDHGVEATDAVGVILVVDEKVIYMTGDTRLRLDRVDEFIGYGQIDVLIGPINGRFGNMNGNELAQLSEKIQPRTTIPCHYGMFAAHGNGPELFIKKMDTMGLDYYIMTMGEGIEI